MKITILGSGTGIPSLKRGAPGLAVQVNRDILLFDSGPGTLSRLLRARIDYRKLDYIFYTHFHPDHICDLAPFLFACRYHSSPRTKPINIVGPKGLKKLYYGLLKLYNGCITPKRYDIKLTEMGRKVYKGNGWLVKSKRMMHIISSFGYRIESNGKSVTYSGDTDYCKGIVDIAKDADLLILECSFPDNRYLKGHLTPRLAGKIARESNCRHLVLTHMYPICDKYDILKQCRKEYKGKTTVAKDLSQFFL